MAEFERVHTARTICNADVDWDGFDSTEYFNRNYRYLQDEDAEIIGVVADFFQRSASRRRRIRTRAIDVGTGANLYPALTMLPFASEIVLYERAASNHDWLCLQLLNPAESWERFWLEIQNGRPEYQRISDPMGRLSRAAKVVRGDLFGLKPKWYDMGTMFFVAESISSWHAEFHRAIRSFVASLVPGAPFAAAFMRSSFGYSVGHQEFPACPVDEHDVHRSLEDVADVEVRLVRRGDLGRDYVGMIVVCGHRK